eukprot:scaffold150446_cov23-Tisochrysis_lutea.AAC.1
MCFSSSHNPIDTTTEERGKAVLVTRPRALWKGSLASKLARVSQKGPQTTPPCAHILRCAEAVLSHNGLPNMHETLKSARPGGPGAVHH